MRLGLIVKRSPAFPQAPSPWLPASCTVLASITPKDLWGDGKHLSEFAALGPSSKQGSPFQAELQGLVVPPTLLTTSQGLALLGHMYEHPFPHETETSSASCQVFTHSGRPAT